MKKSIITTILFLSLSFSLIFSPYFSFSQSQYKGKIGKYPVIFEDFLLQQDKQTIEGRYMYEKIGKWLTLRGKIKEKTNRIIINEYDENNKNTGYFIGILSKDKKTIKLLSWIDKTKKGRKLKVNIRNIPLKEKKDVGLIEKGDKVRRFKMVDYKEIRVFRLLPNGRGVAVSLSIGDNKYYVQVNDKIYGPYEYNEHILDMHPPFEVDLCPSYRDCDYSFGFYPLIFYFDDTNYAFELGKDGKYYVEINNKTYGPYDEFSIYDIVFSPDNSKYGFVFKKDGKWYVNINDKIYGPYKEVGKPEFSPDSSKYG
ncbi:MAG: hypothetical protein ACK4GR_05975, partial [bacterium]